MESGNLVRCPRCGELRPDDFQAQRPEVGDPTPPGVLALPTFGSALKRARGGPGTCECGRRRLDTSESGPLDAAGAGEGRSVEG